MKMIFIIVGEFMGKGYGKGRGHGWGHQLESSGIRSTAARELVLSVMQNRPEHLSAEEVLWEVRKSEPGIGLTTVYRSLEILYQSGLVKKLDFGDGRAVFELNDSLSGKGPHQHLICRKCGQVRDLMGCLGEGSVLTGDTRDHIEREYKFSAEEAEIRVYGLCPDCR